MKLNSKLEKSTSIFSVISSLAKEHNAINLGQGFPDYECDSKLQKYIAQALHEGYNQYAPMSGSLSLREAIANKIEICYKEKLDPHSQICITAGATQAIFTAIMTFVSKGDEVIIVEPAYDCYKPTIELAGGVIKSISISYPTYKIDWNRVQEIISSKTRMIIVNTPHNPTGSVLSSDDLHNLEKLVAGKNIIVLSDEVYEHLIFDGEKHQSVIRYPNLFNQSLCVYSFGKTLHATGWKLGYILGPKYLIEEFKNIHQWNVFSTNSFVQQGIAEYISDPETYQVLPDFFQQKRDFLVDGMSESNLRSLKCSGTYFQLYDYSEISDLPDLEFAKKLICDYGVASIPLSPFYSNDYNDKVVRFCFAKKDSTISKAIERLRGL